MEIGLEHSKQFYEKDKNATNLKNISKYLPATECNRCKLREGIVDGDILKPQRSRHCKFCDNCCLELDHHCYWIGNCVGLGNKKYFFQYGLYVIIMDIFVVINYTWAMVKYWHVYNFIHDWRLNMGIFLAIFTLWNGMTITLNGLWAHTLQGETHIERKFKPPGYYLPYKMSCFRNFKHTFGRSCIGWFLPLPVVQDTGRFENMKERDFPDIQEY